MTTKRTHTSKNSVTFEVLMIDVKYFKKQMKRASRIIMKVLSTYKTKQRLCVKCGNIVKQSGCIACGGKQYQVKYHKE